MQWEAVTLPECEKAYKLNFHLLTLIVGKNPYHWSLEVKAVDGSIIEGAVLDRNSTEAQVREQVIQLGKAVLYEQVRRLNTTPHLPKPRVRTEGLDKMIKMYQSVDEYFRLLGEEEGDYTIRPLVDVTWWLNNGDTTLCLEYEQDNPDAREVFTLLKLFEEDHYCAAVVENRHRNRTVFLLKR